MRFLKTTATALAFAVAALSFGPAEAAPRRKVVVNKYYGGHGHHHHRGGNALAAGVLGFGAGALVGGALARPYYAQPVYVAPAPVYVAPAPVVVYQAWTPDWYSYCGQRYRSFNRQTGYYLGYDGGYHFCR